MIQGTTIHDIPIGLKATFTKAVGDDDIDAFAALTGDFDRTHVDEAFARTTPYGRRIAHGIMILGYMSTASTLVLEGFSRPAVSLGYDRIRFVKPVFIGDTVTVDYEIVDKDEARERTIATVEARNQHGEVVAVATHIQKVL